MSITGGLFCAVSGGFIVFSTMPMCIFGAVDWVLEGLSSISWERSNGASAKSDTEC